MNRKVAIFVQDLKGGGAERVMVNLASGLAETGIPVDMVLVRNQGAHLPGLSPRVRIVDLNTRRVIFSIRRLARYLRDERPAAMVSALVHVNTAAILAGLLARSGTRVVVTEHSDVFNDRANTDSRTVAFAFAAMPVLYRLADRIVAVSHGVADSLAKGARLVRERVDVVYNPVVTPDLTRLAAEPVEHPWLAPGQPPVILAVGRLTEAKDFAMLLKAFAEVRRRRPVRLIVLGEGELRNALESLVASLDLQVDVLLPGFVSNPYAWMRRASVLALSSRWEGLPTVIIEAMACGTPIVATDCPSGPAEILENGTYGRLVPPGDVAAFARALESTLDETTHRARLQRRAEDFSVATVVEQYTKLLLGTAA